MHRSMCLYILCIYIYYIYIFYIFDKFCLLQQIFSSKEKHLKSKEAFIRAEKCNTQYIYGVLTTEYCLTSNYVYTWI